MAQGKTGVFYASGDNIQIRFYYSESYDIVSNTSTITISKSEFKTAIQRGNYQFSGNLKIDGVVLASFNNLFQFVSSADNATWFKMDMLDGTPFPWTLQVKHSNDGTKTINLTADIALSIYGKWGNYSRAISGNEWIRLTDIPRASNVSASNADITRVSKIVISKYVNSYTHTLTYSFGNLSGTIVNNTAASSIDWTLPASFYNQIPNEKSKVGTITCITYYGGSELGRKSCQFRATANEELCKPTLNPVARDINDTTKRLTGNENSFIKYFSNAEVNSYAAARNGAKLVSQRITCGSKSINAGAGTLQGVDAAQVEFTATDSRGYSTSLTINKALVDYTPLTTNLSVERPTTEGVMETSAAGNYFNSTFGAVYNTLLVQLRYKSEGGVYGDWITVSPTFNKNNYTAPYTVSGLNYLLAYTVQVKASDKLSEVYSAEVKVKTQPIFDWSETDFNFNVPITVQGKTLISKEDLLDYVYPIGSVYMGFNGVSPASFLGGSWEQLKKTFLYAACDGGGVPSGSTGGEAAHILTVDELPAHKHTTYTKIYGAQGSYGHTEPTQICDNNNLQYGGPVAQSSESAGGSQAMSLMPPYTACYIWKRVS